MGRAVQTIVGTAANPSSTYTAATMQGSDSATVLGFNEGTSRAYLHQIIRGGATAGAARVTSPRLHDAVRGITYKTDKSGTVFQLPREVGQPLHAVDSLSLLLTGGTNETDLIALTNYYEDLPGAGARLAMYDDIKSYIRNIKPVEVDCSVSATAGAWKDTVLTTTENLLKAGRDYAVLGFSTDAAVDVIAILGPDTGNYRHGLPGADDTFNVTDGYIRNAELHNMPYIPVLNAENINATNVSIAHHATGVSPNVMVVLAELDPAFNAV